MPLYSNKGGYLNRPVIDAGNKMYSYTELVFACLQGTYLHYLYYIPFKLLYLFTVDKDF